MDNMAEVLTVGRPVDNPLPSLSPDPSLSHSPVCLAVDTAAVDVQSRSKIANPSFLPSLGRQARINTRKRIRRPRPEYIRDVRRYITAAWLKHSGQEFNWSPLARENLYRMALTFRAWELMAMWDIYLERPRVIYSVFYMGKVAAQIVADPRFKAIASKHEERFLGAPGTFKRAGEILRGLGFVRERGVPM